MRGGHGGRIGCGGGPRRCDHRRLEPRSAGEEGEAHGGGRARPRSADPRHDPVRRARAQGSRHRGRNRESRHQAANHAQVDQIIAPHAVLATNTSSISITALAAATARPERFIGMHFFNPVPLMGLVELIRGLLTSEATQSRAAEFIQPHRQDPHQREELAGLRGQPRALSDDQRGDIRPAGWRRERRRHRRRHEARLQPPDRTACARRSRRPGYLAVGHGGVPARLRRPQIPAGAAASRNGRGGPARPQERTRVLSLH